MISPRATRAALICAILLSSACGRFGFDALTTGFDDARERGQNDSNAGTDAAAADPTMDAGSPLGADSGSVFPSESGIARDADAQAPGPTDAGMQRDGGSAPANEDAGRDGGDSQLSCASYPGALRCETFDSPPTRGSYSSTSGSITFDQGVMQASIHEGSARATLDMSIARQASGSLYVRVRFSVPAIVELSALNVLAISGGPDPKHDVDVNFLGSDELHLFFTTTDTPVFFPYVLPRERWVCMLVRVDVADATGRASVEFDGKTPFTANGQDTLPAPGLDQIRLGVDWSSPDQAPAMVRFDDLLVSTEYLLGCP